jgi:hypothetical protein
MLLLMKLWGNQNDYRPKSIFLLRCMRGGVVHAGDDAVISEDASAKKTGISSVNAERRSSTPNWEAMQVALERLRINHIAGRGKQAEGELAYLLDQLHHLHVELKRVTVIECERKEVR